MVEKFPYLEKMEFFDENSLPSLKEATLGALELFIREGLPDIEFKDFKRPLVVGSGNAIATAKILFSQKDCIFADESSYKEALEKSIDGVFLFSASGGKHAPIIAKDVLAKNLPIQMITCTNNSQAEQIVGSKNTLVTPKNKEPYTYNTSTYLGWIFAKTKEDPQEIYDFIVNNLAKNIPSNFADYCAYLLVTRDQHSLLNSLFTVKFIELFGRKIARDVKSYEEMRHAITVVPNSQELCICLGEDFDVDFQFDKVVFTLPKDLGTASMMAIGYYIIGCIQEQLPQYFKENISSYIKRNSNGDFGKALSVIVK